MFQFLNSIGTWLSSACALGFAAFWGWSSVFLNTKVTPAEKLSGQAGLVLVIALGVAVLFIGFYAVMTMLRRENKPAQATTRWTAPEEVASDFDPDAIIARHLANRSKMAPPVLRARPAATFRHAPQVRSFGRKVA